MKRLHHPSILGALTLTAFLGIVVLSYFENYFPHRFGLNFPHISDLKRSPFVNVSVSVSPPAVILKFHGGIGNQLFEYACSYGISKEMGWPLYVHLEDLASRSFQSSQRSFALDQFEIHLNVLLELPSEDLIHTLSDEEIYFKQYLHTVKPYLVVNTYCQSEDYWYPYRNQLKAMFRPRENIVNRSEIVEIASDIQRLESVAVHVRRGDALEYDGVYHVPISFQRRAIREMNVILQKRGIMRNPTYFVFSDDIPYAKDNLSDLAIDHKIVYVSSKGFTSIEDFYLMSLCKHIIFPTSTFGWWAAYLNENPEKVVITAEFNPKFWTRRTDSTAKFDTFLHREKYRLESWTVLDSF